MQMMIFIAQTVGCMWAIYAMLLVVSYITPVKYEGDE